MDTGTGRPESGMYGSNRTASDGRPRYHEGLDIAPLKRDRRGNALDTAHAIADGRVAYLNRRPGASNYGNYIVLTHRDPGVGEIYSLYAHLASVDAGLAVGQTISAGHLLGIIGHTPDLPVARSHLHLETGLIINSRYADFAASRKLTNDHANWNGGNLQGFDPADLYARLDAGGCFDLAAYLATLPTAFRVAAQTSKPIDFFKRYPALWHGPTPATGAAVWVVLDFSEEGLPLSGRLATASELFTRSGQLIAVDEEALDRNGRRLLTRQKSVWRLSNSGEDWLALLLY